jgi:predicted RNA-binding Zn-ribbon protein involved in translation (DUF1610 family)
MRTQRIPMPADATCSACQREVTLSAAEREAGAFDCPYCRRHVEALLGSELRCPACRNRLILSAVERSSGTFACPRCRGEFITRAPERQALVPPTVTAELAERDAQTKRLLTISSALGWGGLALAFFRRHHRRRHARRRRDGADRAGLRGEPDRRDRRPGRTGPAAPPDVARRRGAQLGGRRVTSRNFSSSDAPSFTERG